MVRIALCFLLIASLLVAPGRATAIEGFPGRTWGELRYELPERGSGQENAILMGWIEQGVYWFNLNDLKLNTYGTVRYKWDEERLDWNNSIGPGVGIALEKVFPKGPYVRGGVEFIWDELFESGPSEKKAVIYLNWYGAWDLRKSK